MLFFASGILLPFRRAASFGLSGLGFRLWLGRFTRGDLRLLLALFLAVFPLSSLCLLGLAIFSLFGLFHELWWY